MKSPAQPVPTAALKLLSVVIPARDEEGCIASTVEHLHVELRLNNIPHEVIVVDDGSSDRTAEIVTELSRRIPGGATAFERPSARLWTRRQRRADADKRGCRSGDDGRRVRRLPRCGPLLE